MHIYIYAKSTRKLLIGFQDWDTVFREETSYLYEELRFLSVSLAGP